MAEKSVVTTVDLLRHGEPVGGKRYRGQIDDPLSELGWRQMREAVADHCPWDRIVTSSLCRCHDFARELAERHSLPLRTEPRLMEIGFGEWEGRSAEELMAEDQQRLFRFWSDPLNNTPPGAETLHEFEQRVTGAWEDLLQQHAGEHLLVVGHAGMIRMILRHVLDMPLSSMFRLRVDLAGITRIEIESHQGQQLPRLIFHGGQLK
ncbi:alpha-ribazole phosphatase family protein [Thiohalophilus sp.]|uniref:histidine phosphatase family protein n=1 Tax=Thiohalophilus sp. TaxID=3028392 RepID=UPI002ACEDDDF|nr:alpha-ribazole phosphatase family protein [Thiohalophilus sp.]MDZ7803036.1 alpha-ribazole phosphatase family protein [Thiohalophilus sp.]